MARKPRENIRAIETFDTIISAASRVFAEKGFDGTSMRDIAEAAGISKALLFHHFKAKELLYEKVSLQSSQGLVKFVQDRVDQVDDPLMRIKEFMIASAEYFEKNRWAWMASSNSFWNDPNRSARAEQMRRRKLYETLLRNLLTEAVRQGHLREIDVAVTGRLLLSSLNWMNRWYNPEKPLRPAQIAEMYFDIVLKGIGPENR